MPNYTSNLKLEKPLVTDNYDINVSNGNMDKIDLEVKKLQDNKSNNGHAHTKANITDFAHTHSMGEITGLELSSTKVNRPNQKTVEQTLSDNETSISNLQNADGNLSQLQTSNKSNLVGAINELFQNANNGKSTIATAVGSPLSSGDTFGAMGSKIDTLTSKFKTNLNAKGVSTSSADKMSNLIDKVGTISTGRKWAKGSGGKIQGDGYGIKEVRVVINAPIDFDISYVTVITAISIGGYTLDNVAFDSRYSFNSYPNRTLVHGKNNDSASMWIESITSKSFVIVLRTDTANAITSFDWHVYSE